MKKVFYFAIIVAIVALIIVILINPFQRPEQTQQPTCKGTAECFTGVVTDVYDGDTIYVDYVSIRFALASAPELEEKNGVKARETILRICPIGSNALVDEDDGQPEGSFDRIVAVVYCNGVNLNKAVLEEGVGYIDTRFCDESEFLDEDWVKRFGC